MPKTLSIEDFASKQTESRAKEQKNNEKSFGQSVLDTATAVSDFAGGKGVADLIGGIGAKATLPASEAQYVSLPSAKEVAGSALQLGSLAIPSTGLAKGATMGAKALGLGTKAANLLGRSAADAAAGAVFSTGGALQGEDFDAGNIAIGAALPFAGAIGRKVAKPIESVASTVAESGSKAARNVANTIEEIGQNRQARNEIAKKGKAALKVYDETGSSEFLNSIDRTASREGLQSKEKMIELAANHPKLGGGNKADMLPRQVIAEDYVVPRVEALESRLGDLGKMIGNYGAKSKWYGGLRGKEVVDTTDVFNYLVDQARKADVIVTQGKKGLNFSAAPGVSGVDTARINTVKGLFDGFTPNARGRTQNTVEQLDKTRRNLSALTKRTDAAKEIVSPGGPVDNARRMIAKKIGDDYYNATREYSDIVRTLKKLDPDLDVKLSDDAIEEIKKVKFGDFARRVLSNNAANAKGIFRSLDELYRKEAARTGKKVADQDIEDLVDFAGALEEGFGIQPRNSLFGQVKGAVDASGLGSSLAADAITGAPVATAINVGKKILTNDKRNDKRAIDAMRAYIKEALSKK